VHRQDRQGKKAWFVRQLEICGRRRQRHRGGGVMDLVTAEPLSAPSLTGLIERARTTLAEARSAAEVLEAREQGGLRLRRCKVRSADWKGQTSARRGDHRHLSRTSGRAR